MGNYSPPGMERNIVDISNISRMGRNSMGATSRSGDYYDCCTDYHYCRSDHDHDYDYYDCCTDYCCYDCGHYRGYNCESLRWTTSSRNVYWAKLQWNIFAAGIR